MADPADRSTGRSSLTLSGTGAAAFDLSDSWLVLLLLEDEVASTCCASTSLAVVTVAVLLLRRNDEWSPPVGSSPTSGREARQRRNILR